MHIISRKFHAVLDYLSAIVFIGAPWTFNFSHSGNATQVFVFAGVLIFIMSVMTDYEGGLIRRIPMSVHLNMDIFLGVALLASPWVFGFSKEVYLPHLIMGIFSICAGVLTVRSSLSKRLAG